MSDEWVSVSEYAKINNVKLRSVYDWVATKKIPTKIVKVDAIRVKKSAKPKYKIVGKQYI